MRGLLCVVLLVPGLLAAQPLPGGQRVFGSEIVTSAAGESRVTPDRATIFIGVQTHAASAAQASADNARRQRAVLDTLHALGVPSERLSTINFSVTPEQNYNPQGGDRTPRITGYTVSNTVRVEVDKVDQIGKLIDATLAKGANGINSLQFSSSNADPARRTALGEAVDRARGDAEAIAKSAGGHLGDLIEVDASQGTRPTPMYSVRALSMADATPVVPGEQSVSVVITARWRFITDAK